MEILNYQVSDGQSGIRIDRYLSEMNEELSRSYIQKLLKEQKITVNGSADRRMLHRCKLRYVHLHPDHASCM